MKQNLRPIWVALVCASLLGCAEEDAATQAAPPAAADAPAAANAPAAATPAPTDEAQLRAFLPSVAGTYGWETTADTISYDFFPDGRLHIQGPDGEATMWSGTWTLQGDQLTLKNTDEGTEKTVTVSRVGDNIKLGDMTYTRYSP